MIVTPSAVLHVDQSANVTGTSVNGWAALTTNLALPENGKDKNRPSALKHDEDDARSNEDEEQEPYLDLQFSHLIFTDSSSGLIFAKDGTVCTMRCTLDGRSVSGIQVDRLDTLDTLEARGVVPSGVCAVPLHSPRAGAVHDGEHESREEHVGYVFCASMVGDSALLKVGKKTIVVQNSAVGKEEGGSGDANGGRAGAAAEDGMDVDLDVGKFSPLLLLKKPKARKLEHSNSS